MLYAIISDIHSNLEALGTALDKIDKIKVDVILCLGDIVGYNADPNECVGKIKERRIISIMGNHDRACAGIYEPTNFNEYAKEAVFWTRERLRPESRDYLKSLKDTYIFEDKFLIVHGSPRNPDEYIFTSRSAGENLKYLEEKFNNINICFFGHTHIKALYYISGEPGIVSEEKIFLSKEGTYLINPGSIGQPRDMDPRGFFMLFDSEELSVHFEPVSYDIEKTSLKVMKAKLPFFLAERLFWGR